MIVEFIGTPGSGKTTLVPVLANIFAEYNYIARTIVEASRPVVSRTFPGSVINKLAPISLRDPVLWQLFYNRSYFSRKGFSKAHPALVSHVRNTQRARDIPADERDHNLFWWFHLVGYYQFLKPRLLRNEVLLLDEGFAHRVVQLFASDHENLDRDTLSEYLRLIPRPDMLIYVDVPAVECEKRVFDRGIWNRFNHKSRQQVSQFIVNSHIAVNTAVSMLKSQEWDVVEIDNSADSVSPAKQELSNKIPQLLDVISERNIYPD